MGNEIGQFREWSEKEQEDWELLSYPAHRQFHDYIRALNHLYLHSSHLYYDYGFGNFEWADLNSTGRAVFAIRRKTAEGEILAVMHFDCDPEAPYRISLPPCKRTELLLHSGQTCFGGTWTEPESSFHIINQETDAPAQDLQNAVLEIMLRPYDCLIFSVEY